MRYTKAKLELLKDVDLFQMFENFMRGGKSGVFGDRCIQSDNNRIKLYMDKNKIYGHSMSQHLPTGNLQIYENNSITESLVDNL